MALVSIEKLTKRYGDNTVVDEVDLSVGEGEFLTLLGPSGCGKTTTLRCLAGLERPDGGSIRIGDREVVGPGTFVQPNKRGIGMVFQSYALWPHMTVLGNVTYPLKRAKVEEKERRQRANSVLEMVGLSHLRKRSVGTLSGGQQQRVALARAVVAEPPLVLFDEPLSNLDTRLRGTMRDELHALRNRLGTTSVYVTHDQTEALTLSDRIAVLNDGVIQQLGTPTDIYMSPANKFVADFLGFENFIQGQIERAHDGRSLTIRFGDAGCLNIEARQDTYKVGEKVELAIRASDLLISTDSVDREAGLGARIVGRAFLGDQTEFRAQLNNQTVAIRVSSNSETARNVLPGDDIYLKPEIGQFSVFSLV